MALKQDNDDELKQSSRRHRQVPKSISRKRV